MITFIRFFILGTLAFVVSACATLKSPVDNDFRLGPNSTNGLAFGTVTQPIVDVLLKPNTVYVFESIDGKISFEVKAYDIQLLGIKGRDKIGNNEGQMFAVELPAGTYKINRWVVRIGYAYNTTRHPLKPFYFEVQPGKATYIGELNSAQGQSWNTPGTAHVGVYNGGLLTPKVYWYPRIIDQTRRDLALFRNQYPNMKSIKVLKHIQHIGPLQTIEQNQTNNN